MIKLGKKPKDVLAVIVYDVRTELKLPNSMFHVSIMSILKEYSYCCHHFIITLLLPYFDYQSVPGKLAALVRWLHFRGLELRDSTV